MKITYDPKKRNKTLQDRDLDFADAKIVLSGETYELEDLRKDYGEQRMIAAGYLNGRMVIIGYVKREETIHVFSMRKTNAKETKKYKKQFEKK